MKTSFTLLCLFLSCACGKAQFVLDTSNDLIGIYQGSNAFADFDNDGDLDLLITGDVTNGPKAAAVYINDGTGQYTLSNNSALVGVDASGVAVADIDGDDDIDMLITGDDENSTPQTALYLNDGNGIFTTTSHPFPPLWNGGSAFADVDNDGDQDVLLTGRNDENGNEFTQLYTNDGFGNFTAVSSAFTPVQSSSVTFGDIDGDTDLDVLITGFISSAQQHSAQLYLNDGSGVFSLDTENILAGVSDGNGIIADIDNDGDQDILIAGEQFNPDAHITKLYLNDGTGLFVEDVEDLLVTQDPGFDLADIDNDGDLDLMISGETESSGRFTILYLFDGVGPDLFEEVEETDYDGLEQGEVNFADIDGDGDQDVLVSGYNGSLDAYSSLYINEGFANTVDQFNSEWTKDVYPNPTLGNVVLEAENGFGKAEVYVRNVAGAIVQKYIWNATPIFELKLPNANGVYFIEVISEKENRTFKVVKI